MDKHGHRILAQLVWTGVRLSPQVLWLRSESLSYTAYMEMVSERCALALCCASSFSRVCLFLAPWTVARQASPSMGILQAGIRHGLPCPPPGDLPKPGVEPRSPALQVDSLLSEPPGKPRNTGVGSLSLLQGIFQPRN